MGGLGRQGYAAFAGSICMISHGMAYGWLSPVITTLSDDLGEIRATKEQISWIAADIEIGNLVTPLLASYLMDRFGRKWPMLCSVPLMLTSWILTVTTRSVTVLYVKRVMDGLTMGFMLTIAPIYLAEIAEANIRGSIMLSITVTWYAGILIQFCVGTYLSYNVSAWINFMIPILYFILFSFLPESPYYLMMKKQKYKAARSLAWFRNTSLNHVSEELNSIADYLEEDSKNKESWRALFSNKIYRRCLVVMSVVVLATLMTGLTTVFSYASEMFADIGGPLDADSCSVAIAAIFFCVALVTFFIVDKVGRRPLLIVSGCGCFLSNLSSTCYSYFKDDIKYKWIPIVTIGSYTFFVSIGLIPIMLAFQGEIFPSSIKEIASGLTMLLITISSLTALKLYYIISTSVGMYINYLIYTVVAGTTTVWLYYNAPETKNKTFSELFKEFEELYGNEKEKPTPTVELTPLRSET